MLQIYQTFFLILVLILGLVIGSFLNVVIYRLPLKISIAKGRSFCPHCHHQLKAIDLIPVFSWLFLKGKCRYCSAPIPYRYPVVELLNMIGWLVIYLQLSFTNPVLTVSYFALTSILICLAFIDYDTKEVPTSLIIGIIMIAIINIILQQITIFDALIGAIIVSIPLLIVSLLTKGGIGGGDIEYFAAVGLLLGPKMILFSTGLGYIIAAISLLPRLKKLDRKQEYPMLPSLTMATYLTILFGSQIISWYLSLI